MCNLLKAIDSRDKLLNEKDFMLAQQCSEIKDVRLNINRVTGCVLQLAAEIVKKMTRSVTI